MFQKAAKHLLSVLMTAALLLSLGLASAGAEELPDPVDPAPQESVIEDSSDTKQQSDTWEEPETDPYEEPETTPYEEPTDEPYQEDETEAAAPVDTPQDNDSTSGGSDTSYYQSAQDPYLDNNVSAKAAKSINSVKVDKSVSDKTYSTDYTAGVVSWICVGVGVVVVLVMIISTKISGSRASRRRI